MTTTEDAHRTENELPNDLEEVEAPGGEFVQMDERLVVSSAVGKVEFAAEAEIGTIFHVGDKVAVVGGQLVCSAFSGRLMGVLALNGQRITAGQALVWLAPDDQPGAMTS